MIYKNTDRDIFSLYSSRVLLRENTELNVESLPKMDEKLWKDFEYHVQRCKHRLLKEYPWFGIMMSKLRTVPTFTLDTMGVDNFGNIFMNPLFTLSMSEKETMGVFAHECLHVMTLSFFRQENRDKHTLWNIATDYLMNADLVEMNMSLPEKGLIPERRGDRMFVVFKNKQGKVLLETDITDKSAEDLYEELEKVLENEPRPEKKKRIFKKGDRVALRKSKKKGTVISVTGDKSGEQIVDVEWDDPNAPKTKVRTAGGSLGWTNKINEEVQRGISSANLLPLVSKPPGGGPPPPGDFPPPEIEEVAFEDDEDDEDDNDGDPGDPGGDEGGDGRVGKGEGGSGGDSGIEIKGELSKIINDLAKDQEKFSKHIDKGDPKPTPLINPDGDEDYLPDYTGNALNKIKEKVKDAEATIKSRGLGAGGPRSLKKETYETKTNWKNLLRRFMAGTEKIRETWSKLNKRAYAAGYYAKGLRSEITKLNVVVAVDTSGSITDAAIALFTSEILNIAKAFPKAKIKIILWHSEAYGDIDLDVSTMSISSIMSALHSLPYKGGGTLLSSVADYLETKYPKKKFGGLIVFTDGHIESNPKLINVPNKLFLILPKGDKSILQKYGPTYEIDVYS